MSEKGKKVLNIFKRIGIGLSIGFNVLFLVAVIIGSSGLKKQNNNVNCALAESDIVFEKIDFKYDNRKYATYDDNNYSITLTADELNNYTWENFSNFLEYLGNHNVSDYFDLNYNDNTLIDYDSDYSNSSLLYGESSDSFQIGFNSNDFPFKFSYHQGNYSPFEYSLSISCYDSLIPYYDNFKQAIDLDIQSNESNINDGIFETLTDSVVAFVGSLGNGIVAMTSIFYDSVNNNLTTIGLLSVIVVAVSLAYFLFRLIIGLIRMRG